MNAAQYIEILGRLGHKGNEPTFLILDEFQEFQTEDKGDK